MGATGGARGEDGSRGVGCGVRSHAGAFRAVPARGDAPEGTTDAVRGSGDGDRGCDATAGVGAVAAGEDGDGADGATANLAIHAHAPVDYYF